MSRKWMAALARGMLPAALAGAFGILAGAAGARGGAALCPYS